MKRLLMTTAALALLSTAAQAETIRLATAGIYAVDYYRDGGGEMCRMGAHRDWSNGDQGFISFKWQRSGLFVHIWKSNWNDIAQDTKVPVSIEFNNGSNPWTGNGNGNGKGIQMSFGDNGTKFMKDLVDSSKMTITFTNSKEQPWVSSMDGHIEAEKAFQKCVDGLRVKAPSVKETAPPAEPSAQVSSRPMDKGGI